MDVLSIRNRFTRTRKIRLVDVHFDVSQALCEGGSKRRNVKTSNRRVIDSGSSRRPTTKSVNIVVFFRSVCDDCRRRGCERDFAVQAQTNVFGTKARTENAERTRSFGDFLVADVC